MNRLMSLRKNRCEVLQDCRKFTDRFRGFCRMYPQFNKGKPEGCHQHCKPVGLANTRTSTDYAQKSPRSTDLEVPDTNERTRLSTNRIDLQNNPPSRASEQASRTTTTCSLQHRTATSVCRRAQPRCWLAG
jgi:hypothetical protein